jgi:hypothetical protein
MRAKRPPLTTFATAALIVCVFLGLTAGTALAKKGKKGGGTVNITQAVNAPITDATPGSGPNPTNRAVTNFSANVGKKFKGRRIRDVNATLQITGTSVPPSPSDSDPVNDLGARLTAPNGATVWIFGTFSLSGNLIGPLTFDDETSVVRMSSGTPNGDPTLVFSPYLGRVQPNGPFTSGNGSLQPLSVMDDGPARGTWRLTMIDYFPGNSNTLVSWGITVQTGKPYLPK